MIRVESVTIKEFRGIRELTLEFGGKSFAICGPNGTGKSGVVDALEFVLTGTVSRLTGEGRKEISLLQHGPHVDKRNDPDRACVSARVTIPSLQKTVTIERTIKHPGIIRVTPDDPLTRLVLQLVAGYPEVVLSRRELIRYVLSTPGKRAEEVQALLHLDQIEQVRSTLLKIANACGRQLELLKSASQSAAENLRKALEISEIRKEQVLEAANARRRILDLSELPDLDATTSLRDGITTSAAAQVPRIPKTQAAADLKAFEELSQELSGYAENTTVAEVISELTAVASDPAFASGLIREGFYQAGLGLADAAACPLCDTEWDIDALKSLLLTKLQHLKELTRKRKTIEDKLRPILTTLRKLDSTIVSLVAHGGKAKPPLEMAATASHGKSCKDYIARLTELLPLTNALSALAAAPNVPRTVAEEVSTLTKVVAAIPEPTKQDAARDWLTVAQERLDFWREAKRRQKIAEDQASLTRRISDIYTSTSDGVLSGMYLAVQERLRDLYRFINRNDEEKFEARLVPSLGKLGFDVDFYGRGYFPPGAYHSEGHQDAMGLCLYLALMRHLRGAAFTFAILDDVLMSVDAGHRREICALLKREYPDTQFIMTTHDPVWMRHMKTEGLIAGKASVQFRNWDVDNGPARCDTTDVWSEIEGYLRNSDVRSAAALLRNFLEYESSEICHRLRAPVAFRGDAQYQLGELLPAAVGRLGKLYGMAKSAAQNWGHDDMFKKAEELDARFKDLVRLSNVEQWQINPAIHYNEWANFVPNDFCPVIAAFRDLLHGFTCSDCAGYLRVSPERDTPESLRCDCGKINFNLVSKKSR